MEKFFLKDYRRYLYLLGAALLTFTFWGCAAISPEKGPEATGPEHVFFPPLPEEPRLQFLVGINGLDDYGSFKFSFKDFITGRPQQRHFRLLKPYGLAMRDGVIYVCDTRKNDINVLDIANGTYRIIKTIKGGGPTLKKPINIVVTEDGTKYFNDTLLGAVIVLDSDDRLVTMLESEDIERISGVAVYKDKIFVSDIKGNKVVVFEKGTWKQLYTFGSKGRKPGEFIRPVSITADEEGNIYVSESGSPRVQKLTADGTSLQFYGQGLGDRPGEFGRLRGVAVDREERVYIVDVMNNVVQIFDKENRLLLFFGTAGTSPGDTLVPAQVIIDYDNVSLFEKYVAPGYEVEYLIIVTSQVGPRLVNVYGFLKREETGTGDPNKESN